MSHTNLVVLASVFSVTGFTFVVAALDRAARAVAAFVARRSHGSAALLAR